MLDEEMARVSAGLNKLRQRKFEELKHRLKALLRARELGGGFSFPVPAGGDAETDQSSGTARFTGPKREPGASGHGFA